LVSRTSKALHRSYSTRLHGDVICTAHLNGIYLRRYKLRIDDLDFLAHLWFSGMAAGLLVTLAVHFLRGTATPIIQSMETGPIGTSVIWLTVLYLVKPVIESLFGIAPAFPQERRGR
jgi:hypothetical protein